MTPIEERISRALHKWRRRDERTGEGASWYGIAVIRQAAGGQKQADKDMVRGALISLIPQGKVEVAVCTNGVYWRSAIPYRLPR